MARKRRERGLRGSRAQRRAWAREPFADDGDGPPHGAVHVVPALEWHESVRQGRVCAVAGEGRRSALGPGCWRSPGGPARPVERGEIQRSAGGLASTAVLNTTVHSHQRARVILRVRPTREGEGRVTRLAIVHESRGDSRNPQGGRGRESGSVRRRRRRRWPRARGSPRRACHAAA